MQILKITSIVSVLALCSACSTSKPVMEGQLSPYFGSSIKHNIAAHAIAPTDAQKANTYIPANPARAALARKNYEENTIVAPEIVDPRDADARGKN